MDSTPKTIKDDDDTQEFVVSGLLDDKQLQQILTLNEDVQKKMLLMASEILLENNIRNSNDVRLLGNQIYSDYEILLSSFVNTKIENPRLSQIFESTFKNTAFNTAEHKALWMHLQVIFVYLLPPNSFVAT